MQISNFTNPEVADSYRSMTLHPELLINADFRQWQRKSGRYTTTISLTPRLTPGAMYALRVQFVKSGITSSVHNDLSLMKRPSE